MKGLRFILPALVVIAAMLPEIVLAQAIGNNPSLTAGTSGSAGCNAIVNSTAVQTGNGWLSGIVVTLTGMPFKVAAALSFVMGAIMLFLDSGQLGHHVRHIITIVLGVVLTGLIVGFLFGPSVAIAQC